jgi:uncharacterized protein involved in response to NO
MSALPTRIEKEAGRPLTPREIFDLTAARETALSRLLILYIITGLVFMLLPGTFLGVWNLLAISSRRAADAVSPAWIQAHGHAQIFGWIGTFILGIGFYSIPKLRRLNSFALSSAWWTWCLWSSGVVLRWLAGVYRWHWRESLPASATLELAAFVIFLRTVSGHRPQDSAGENIRQRLDEWILVVVAATLGLLLTLLLNFGLTVFLALRATSPDVPAAFNQRFLMLQTWGFLVPFVWGFSAKWLPVFLGLRPLYARLLLSAVALNFAGVLAALANWMQAAVVLLLAGIITAAYSLRLFEPLQRPAKVKGVHSSFPVFVRLAYVWALIAASLAVWAASVGHSHGIWGASRHALTVGFLATMVFAIGQRILPAFSGMRLLFSTKLMFVALLLLSAGCLLRVTSEILAYQGFLGSAWSWLPASALTEMTAVTIFAVNLFASFAGQPPSARLFTNMT